MPEVLARLFEGRSALDLMRDAVDVLVVAYVIYRLLLTLRGTRAMQMGVGLGMVFLLYAAAEALELITLLSLLQYVLSSIILVVVVVFQNDIRRALVRVGGQAWLGRGRRQEQSRVIDEVVAAVTELARHRIGAIIAFEQDANLLEFTRSEGVNIGAAVTRELLVAMFYPESVNKLHDGAVLIRDLKIARAGMFFPMPEARGLDRQLGTRHRAALGITEETDAVVVVVSEERGTISFCFNGNIVQNIDATALRQTLMEMLGQKSRPAPRSRPAAPRPSLAPSGRSATASPLPRTSKLPDADDAPASEPTSRPPPAIADTRPAEIPPPPRESSAPEATATPLPISVRKAAAAPADGPSREEPPVHRSVSTPMPRSTRSSMAPPRTPTPSNAFDPRAPDPARTEEEAPTSSRPSFVSAARPVDERSNES